MTEEGRIPKVCEECKVELIHKSERKYDGFSGYANKHFDLCPKCRKTYNEQIRT